jgi:hypothetical protein
MDEKRGGLEVRKLRSRAVVRKSEKMRSIDTSLQLSYVQYALALRR